MRLVDRFKIGGVLRYDVNSSFSSLFYNWKLFVKGWTLIQNNS